MRWCQWWVLLLWGSDDDDDDDGVKGPERKDILERAGMESCSLTWVGLMANSADNDGHLLPLYTHCQCGLPGCFWCLIVCADLSGVCVRGGELFDSSCCLTVCVDLSGVCVRGAKLPDSCCCLIVCAAVWHLLLFNCVCRSLWNLCGLWWVPWTLPSQSLTQQTL